MGSTYEGDLELQNIQNTIINAYGDDVKSKFVIGDELTKVKMITNIRFYLHFMGYLPKSIYIITFEPLVL